MKKFTKIVLCIALCFSVLAAMGVAVSAAERHPSYPGYSVATRTFKGGSEYRVYAVMSMSQDYTSYDIYWSGAGIESSDTGGSSYGEIGFDKTVYGNPSTRLDWNWMSIYHSNGDYDWYTVTIII